jgi:hypothetical protein
MEGNGHLSTLFTALDIAIKHTADLVYPVIAYVKCGEINREKELLKGSKKSYRRHAWDLLHYVR